MLQVAAGAARHRELLLPEEVRAVAPGAVLMMMMVASRQTKSKDEEEAEAIDQMLQLPSEGAIRVQPRPLKTNHNYDEYSA